MLRHLALCKTLSSYLWIIHTSPLMTIDIERNIYLRWLILFIIIMYFCVQLSMLTARLNGAPIGLSAMGMFVIDKPMILTVSRHNPFYVQGYFKIMLIWKTTKNPNLCALDHVIYNIKFIVYKTKVTWFQVKWCR